MQQIQDLRESVFYFPTALSLSHDGGSLLVANRGNVNPQLTEFRIDRENGSIRHQRTISLGDDSTANVKKIVVNADSNHVLLLREKGLVDYYRRSAQDQLEFVDRQLITGNLNTELVGLDFRQPSGVPGERPQAYAATSNRIFRIVLEQSALTHQEIDAWPSFSGFTGNSKRVDVKTLSFANDNAGFDCKDYAFIANQQVLSWGYDEYETSNTCTNHDPISPVFKELSTRDFGAPIVHVAFFDRFVTNHDHQDEYVATLAVITKNTSGGHTLFVDDYRTTQGEPDGSNEFKELGQLLSGGADVQLGRELWTHLKWNPSADPSRMEVQIADGADSSTAKVATVCAAVVFLFNICFCNDARKNPAIHCFNNKSDNSLLHSKR